MYGRRTCNCLFNLAMILAIWLPATTANAVPSFARQTGQNCSTCHTSWLELTPFGRHFKLTGYTIGERNWMPLAVMAQVGMTSTENSNDTSGNSLVRKDGAVRLSGISLFLAGKATDNLGAFIQWTVDHDAPTHSHVDNVDIRAAWDFNLADKELILGATLHNNPTLQDVWNSTPAFGYPFTWSGGAVATMGTLPVTTEVDGALGQQVAGTGAYAYWNRSLYAELSFYRTADGSFSALRAGIPKASQANLQGENPYWRLAYTRDWGPNSLMLGTYGMKVDLYSDPLDTNSPVNKFTDVAFDTQYQFITDPHIFTAQATWIHEKQHWNDGSSSNASDTLNTAKGKISYYYQRKYGGTLGLFSTTGTADPMNASYGANNGVSNGNSKPNTQGYIAELDYLPLQNVRLMLQYNGFWKYLGASSNVDGMGRRASDNNSLFLNLWLLY